MARRIWNGTNGAWTTASNWYPSVLPTRGDSANITAGIVDANGVDTRGITIVIDAVRADITTELSVDNANLGVGSYTSLIGAGNVAFLMLNNANTNGVVVATQGPGEIIVNTDSNAGNHGWWGIASPTQSSLTLGVNGHFTNFGGIESGANGSFAMAMSQDQINYGSFQVDPGGGISFSSGDNTPSTFNTLINRGSLVVNGGAMYVGANVKQGGAGKTIVTNNGALTLAGKFDGGTIDIHSGMLNFAPAQFTPGPYTASEMTASIAFTGQTGEIDLGEAVTATYRAATNDIQVMVPWEGGTVQAADFHLVGSYTASEFSFGSNGQIYFNHS
jgi:hypothetical protein